MANPIQNFLRAAKNGNLKALIAAHKKALPGSLSDFDYGWAFRYAAENGDPQILKQVHILAEDKITPYFLGWAFRQAAKNNQVETLKLVHDLAKGQISIADYDMAYRVTYSPKAISQLAPEGSIAVNIASPTETIKKLRKGRKAKPKEASSSQAKSRQAP
jgi:hypothetical protein